MTRKKGDTLHNSEQFGDKNSGTKNKNVNDSIDSFDEEVARVDKDCAEKILDEDLCLANRFAKGNIAEESEEESKNKSDSF